MSIWQMQKTRYKAWIRAQGFLAYARQELRAWQETVMVLKKEAELRGREVEESWSLLPRMSAPSRRRAKLEVHRNQAGPGRPKGHSHSVLDKAIRALVLRDQKMSLVQIGTELKVTRERVRQLLGIIGRDDASRPHYVLNKWSCLVCGKELWGMQGKSKTCSRTCFRALHGRTPTAIEKERGTRVLELRAQGLRWTTIGTHLGFSSDVNRAARAQHYAKIYARKTGLNINWAFEAKRGPGRNGPGVREPLASIVAAYQNAILVQRSQPVVVDIQASSGGGSDAR